MQEQTFTIFNKVICFALPLSVTSYLDSPLTAEALSPPIAPQATINIPGGLGTDEQAVAPQQAGRTLQLDLTLATLTTYRSFSHV